MLNVIISEKLYDEEFVKKWTVGFNKLAEHVKQYSPEEVERLSWVPAEAIREMARMFALNHPACIVQGTNSLDQHGAGVQTARAIATLEAITGNFDVPGGFTTSSALHLSPLRYLDRLEEKPLGIDSFPLFYEVLGRIFGEGQLSALREAILTGQPYPVKAMIVSASNPLTTWPNSRKAEEALRKLDFLVVFDLFMTQTAELADIVLPAASFLERVGISDVCRLLVPMPYVMLGKKAIEPLGDCWSDLKFWLELAKRMGYGEYFPWETEEEAIDYVLKPSGLSVQYLAEEKPDGVFFSTVRYKQYEQKGFQTPSGKVELYSQTLEKLGLDPLPTHREFEETPVSNQELAREYPLVLTTGARMAEYTHSQLRNVPRLSKRAPEPKAQIHPETAAKYGISDGQMMIVETRRGSIEIRAEVTDSIVPGVVNLPHGWGQANANILTDEKSADPVTGCPALKSILCRVKPKI
jgi:anaerobic selenocysteine-containing dehydrogenase